MQVMQMHSQPTQASHSRCVAPGTVVLDVATVGYLIPRAGDAWRVHSVFANACNFCCDDLLLTLVTPRLGGGPTTMVLRRPLAQDLRGLFLVGGMGHPRDDA